MSKISKMTLICQKCGKEFEAVYYDSINTAFEPNALEIVRTGNNISYVCPECGHTGICKRPMLYHDQERDFMVQYAPDMQTLRDFTTGADSMYNQFGAIFNEAPIMRACGDYRRFIEKIEILTAGYNDIVIEFYKQILLQCYTEEDDTMGVIMEFTPNFDDVRMAVHFRDKDRKIEYHHFVKEVYDEILESIKDKPYFGRHNDYVVNDLFVIRMDQAVLDYEPLHIDFLRPKKSVILVDIPTLKQQLYYRADDMNLPGTQLVVPYGKENYEGVVVEQTLISEAMLGFSFDKLKTPTKIQHTLDSVTNLMEVMIAPRMYDGLETTFSDCDMSDSDFEKYVEGALLYHEGECVAQLKSSYLEKDTRFIILSNHPDNWKYIDGVAANIYIDGYFKVLKKFRKNGKKFIILMHLLTEFWTLGAVLNDTLHLPNGKSLLQEVEERIEDKTFDKNQSINLSKQYYQEMANPIGFVENRLNIVKSYVEIVD